MEESENVREIKKLFLDVRFAKKDRERLQKRIKNSNIKEINSEHFKGNKNSISSTQYRAQVDELLRQDLISEENKANLLELVDEKSEKKSVLVEANPNPRIFGFVAAAKCRKQQYPDDIKEGIEYAAGKEDDDDEEEVFDVVHVVCRGECKLSIGCCNWFTPARQKKIKQAYIDALVISYLRTKVIEELRIEKLTTRGQHHRKDRFKSRKTSQQSQISNYSSDFGSDMPSVDDNSVCA